MKTVWKELVNTVRLFGLGTAALMFFVVFSTYFLVAIAAVGVVLGLTHRAN